MMNQRGRVCQRNFRPFVAALSLAMALTGQTFGQTVVPSDREGLLKGLGIGLASYAEENGYPGPKHVLELKDELGLTQDQLKKTEALQKMVAISAAAKGQQIVQAEEELNELFEAGTINGKVLRSSSGRSETCVPTSSSSILQAHLRMKQVLTADQIGRYKKLRGHEGKREN